MSLSPVGNVPYGTAYGAHQSAAEAPAGRMGNRSVSREAFSQSLGSRAMPVLPESSTPLKRRRVEDPFSTRFPMIAKYERQRREMNYVEATKGVDIEELSREFSNAKMTVQTEFPGAALRAASALIFHPAHDLREGALELFSALIKRNIGIKTAISIAEETLSGNSGMTSDWGEAVPYMGLDLYEELFEHGIGIKEAVRVTQKTSVPFLHRLQLAILLAKFVPCDGFAVLAERGMESSSDSVLYSSVKLFKALFEGRDRDIRAWRAYTKALDSEDLVRQCRGVDLYEVVHGKKLAGGYPFEFENPLARGFTLMDIRSNPNGRNVVRNRYKSARFYWEHMTALG